MKCTEHGKVIPHYRCEESERWLDERTPQPAPGCDRCLILRKEAKFQHEMQILAADTAAGIADLNDDGRVQALRRALRQEIERREKAEHENAVLAYRLAEATGTLP